MATEPLTDSETAQMLTRLVGLVRELEATGFRVRLDVSVVVTMPERGPSDGSDD